MTEAVGRCKDGSDGTDGRERRIVVTHLDAWEKETLHSLDA